MAIREQKLFRWIGNARLATGIIGLGMCFFVFGEVVISVWWLVLPLVLFLILVVIHARVVESLERANRAVLFYEGGLDRLENRWSGKGETGDRFRNPSHLYEEDLDIFGKGSLFELLSTARTRAGEDALAHWLLAPAAREEAAARQEAVSELQPCLDLREELAVLGEAVRSTMDTDAVARWGEAPEVRFPNGARFIALILGAAVAVTFGLYMAEVTSRTPFLVVLLVELGYAFFLGGRTLRVSASVSSPSRDLALLGKLLARLENEPFQAPLLLRMQAELKASSRKRLAACAAWLPGWIGNATFYSLPSPWPFCGARKSPWLLSAGASAPGRTFGPGSPEWVSSRRCSRWPDTAMSILTTFFPS